MKDKIIIKEKKDKLELKIERFIKDGWRVISRTYDKEIISELVIESVENIKSYNFNDIFLNINLDNKAELIIFNYPSLKEKKILRPLRNRIDRLEQRSIKRKRNVYRTIVIPLLAMAGFSNLKNKDIESSTTEDITVTYLSLNDDIALANSVLDEVDDDTVKALNNVREVEKIEIKEMSFQEDIPDFGVNAYDERITYVHENYGKITEKYAYISGIDQRIIECILAQERTKHSREVDNGGAIGIAQIQVNQHLGRELTLHNYITGKDDVFNVTMDLLRDLEGNIKVCATIMQNNLDLYNGNIFIALQAYNYGNGAINTVLKRASEESGISKDDIINDPSSLFWIKNVKDYSKKRGDYGDDDYLNNVLSRYRGTDFKPNSNELPVLLVHDYDYNNYDNKSL